MRAHEIIPVVTTTALPRLPVSGHSLAAVGATNIGEKGAQEPCKRSNYAVCNATLGVELPLTNFSTQTTIRDGYTRSALPKSITDTSARNLMEITHECVEYHFIHFHLFKRRLSTRRMDGQDAGAGRHELGWKENCPG